MPTKTAGLLLVDPTRLAAALALAAALREAGLTPRGYTLRRPDAPVRVAVQDSPRCRRESRSPHPALNQAGAVRLTAGAGNAQYFSVTPATFGSN